MHEFDQIKKLRENIKKIIDNIERQETSVTSTDEEARKLVKEIEHEKTEELEIEIRDDIFDKINKQMLTISTLPEIFTRALTYFSILAGVGFWFNIYEISMEYRIRKMMANIFASNLGDRTRLAKYYDVRPSFWIALHSPPGTGRTTFITSIVAPLVNKLMLEALQSVREEVDKNIRSVLSYYLDEILEIATRTNMPKFLIMEEIESRGLVNIVAKLAVARAYLNSEEAVGLEQIRDVLTGREQICDKIGNILREIDHDIRRIGNSTCMLLDLFKVERPGSWQGLVDAVEEIAVVSRAVLKMPYVFLLFTEAGRIWEESRSVEYLRGLYEILTHLYDGKGKIFEYSRRRMGIKRRRALEEGIISYAVIEAQRPEIFLSQYEIEQGFARRVLWLYSEDVRIIDVTPEEASIADALLTDEREMRLDLPQDLLDIARACARFAYSAGYGRIVLSIADSCPEIVNVLNSIWKFLNAERIRKKSLISIYSASSFYHVLTRLLLARILTTEGVRLQFTKMQDIAVCTVFMDIKTTCKILNEVTRDLCQFLNAALSVLMRVGYRELVTGRRLEHVNLILNLIHVVRKLEEELGRVPTVQELYSELQNYISIVSLDILLDALIDAAANGKLNIIVVKKQVPESRLVTDKGTRTVHLKDYEIYIASSPTRCLKHLLYLYYRHYGDGMVMLDLDNMRIVRRRPINEHDVWTLTVHDSATAELLRQAKRQGLYMILEQYSAPLPETISRYYRKNRDKIHMDKIRRDLEHIRQGQKYITPDDDTEQEEENRQS